MAGQFRRRRRTSDRGAAAVEFALVVPIFLLLVFGMITFGLVFASQLSMNSAARDAARAGVVQALGGSGLTCQSIAQQARDQVSPLGGKQSQVAVKVQLSDGVTYCTLDANKSAVTGSLGKTMCTDSNYSKRLVVVLSYTAKSPLGLVPAAKSIDLTATGSFTCEYS